MERILRNPLQFWIFSNFSPADCKNANGLSKSLSHLCVVRQQTEALKVALYKPIYCDYGHYVWPYRLSLR
jgi:hypothetical protein